VDSTPLVGQTGNPRADPWDTAAPPTTNAVGHPASLRDYFQLAWLTCSLAMIGGALDAVLETEDAVHDAAYVRRSDKQTE
jgi:hypothetical protein